MPRTIFIADAASPLGQACAIRLGRAGWNVVMGASSLSNLRSVCDELPDHATSPHRCIPTDRGNVLPVIERAEARFGQLDAVLMNYRPKRMSQRRTLDGQVAALTTLAQVAQPALMRSSGHFVISGLRSGTRSLSGAVQTAARNALRTLSDGLASDWAEDPVSVSLVEPDGLDGPKPMARRIARVLNGAPRPRPVVGQIRIRA